MIIRMGTVISQSLASPPPRNSDRRGGERSWPDGEAGDGNSSELSAHGWVHSDILRPRARRSSSGQGAPRRHRRRNRHPRPAWASSSLSLTVALGLPCPHAHAQPLRFTLVQLCSCMIVRLLPRSSSITTSPSILVTIIIAIQLFRHVMTLSSPGRSD